MTLCRWHWEYSCNIKDVPKESTTYQSPCKWGLRLLMDCMNTYVGNLIMMLRFCQSRFLAFSNDDLCGCTLFRACVRTDETSHRCMCVRWCVAHWSMRSCDGFPLLGVSSGVVYLLFCRRLGRFTVVATVFLDVLWSMILVHRRWLLLFQQWLRRWIVTCCWLPLATIYDYLYEIFANKC